MWDKIKPFIDSGKKLKIKPDKLFYILIANKFAGTLILSHKKTQIPLVFYEGQVGSPNTYEEIARILCSSLCMISSDQTIPTEPVNNYEFLYTVLQLLSEEKIDTMLASIEDKIITISPEAMEFHFIKDVLKKFQSKNRLPLYAFTKKDLPVIYFLLLTESAGLLEATEEEKKAFEKRKLREETSKNNEHNISEQPTESSLKTYISNLKKYKDLFDLFSVSEEFEEVTLRKNYMQIIQRLHPDKLAHEEESVRKEAAVFATVVNNCYKLLKDQNTVKRIIKLQKRYGAIRNKTQFERLDEIEDLRMKGEMLFKLKEYDISFKLFDQIYSMIDKPELLDRIVSSLLKAEKFTIDEKAKKLAHFLDEYKKKQYKIPTMVMFLQVDFYEQNLDYKKALRTVKAILARRPDDTKAKALLKRMEYYAQKNM